MSNHGLHGFTRIKKRGESAPRKMRDSGIAWIGDVPEGWGIVPIRVAFNEVKIKNTDGAVENALRFSMGTIVPKENFDAQTDNYVADTILNYTIVRPLDVVLNGLNLNYDFVSKRVAIVRDHGVITSAYITIRNAREDACCTHYYLYLLKSYDSYKVFHNMGEGVRKILNYNILKRQPILLPPLSEQRAIAGYLDDACGKIDGLREKVEKQIAALEEYKKSVITEAVTGKVKVEIKGIGNREEGISAEGSSFTVSKRDPKTMKPSGVEWIGDVPEGWRVKRFCFEFSFSKGLGITKADLVDEGVPVISYGQIHSKDNSSVMLKQELLRYVPEDTACNDESAKLRFGDIVFADTSEDYDGAGNCVRIHDDKEIYAGYHTLVARPKDPENSHFLIYLFQAPSWRSQVRRNVNGIKVFSVTQKVFKRVSIVLPPLPEQEAIAGYLDKKCAAIDATVAKCRKQLDNLAEYKKSLIYECVTGKREVA